MTLPASFRIARAIHLRALMDSGLTLTEAGAQYGIGKERVRQIVGGAKRHHRWRTPMRQIAKPRQAEIVGLLLSGAKVKDVAQRFRVSVNVIGRLCAITNVYVVPKNKIHGTLPCHRNGCRCEPCRRACREYGRKVYAARVAKAGRQVRVCQKRRKEPK